MYVCVGSGVFVVYSSVEIEGSTLQQGLDSSLLSLRVGADPNPTNQRATSRNRISKKTTCPSKVQSSLQLPFFLLICIRTPPRPHSSVKLYSLTLSDA